MSQVASLPSSADPAPELLSRAVRALAIDGAPAQCLWALTQAAIAPGHTSASASASVSEGSPQSALPGVPADVREVVFEACSEALGSCLEALTPMGGLPPPGGGVYEAVALKNLQSLVKCLSSSTPQGGGEQGDIPLGDLRDMAWQMLQDVVDGLDPSAYSRPSVVQVMDVMAAISTQQVGTRLRPAMMLIVSHVGCSIFCAQIIYFV